MSDTLADVLEAEDHNQDGPTYVERRHLLFRYNIAAPFVFAGGVIVTAAATSHHMLHASALLAAVVTAAILFCIVVCIIKSTRFSTILAVLTTLLGAALFFAYRHSVIHLLIPAIIWVVLIALGCLVGVHIYRGRR